MPPEATPVRNSWMCSFVIGEQDKPNNIEAMTLYLKEGFFGFGTSESDFDLSSCSTKEELKERILSNYPPESIPKKLAVDQYWKFAKEAKVGDRVFLCSYKGIIYASGEIIEGYRYAKLDSATRKVSSRFGFLHTIGIKWKAKDAVYAYREWLPVDFGIPDTAGIKPFLVQRGSFQGVAKCYD